MSAHDPTEREVVDLVERALRSNAADLLRYLLRRIDRDEAPDVLADVFMTTWRRRDVVPQDPLRARMWLFGVARRTVANHRRSGTRASALTARLRVALEESVASGATSYPGSVADEREREVRAAVAALPPRQRELVRLVHWDAMTLTEAAEIAGIRASTARSHYARARERLERELSAPDGLEPDDVPHPIATLRV
jgi:RNA polymerase sigma-70 factor (ECF subfamily)